MPLPTVDPEHARFLAVGPSAPPIELELEYLPPGSPMFFVARTWWNPGQDVVGEPRHRLPGEAAAYALALAHERGNEGAANDQILALKHWIRVQLASPRL
jgi:hypothetical protein